MSLTLNTLKSAHRHIKEEQDQVLGEKKDRASELQQAVAEAKINEEALQKTAREEAATREET